MLWQSEVFGFKGRASCAGFMTANRRYVERIYARYGSGL